MNRTPMLTLAIALVTLAASLPQPASAQPIVPPSGATDFVLISVHIEPPVVGIRQTVVARVLNNGTEEGMATVSFWWGSAGRPLQTGSSGVATFPQSIQPRQRVNFTFDWVPDPTQTGNGTVIAEVRPTVLRETSPLDNSRSVEGFVTYHKMDVSLVSINAPVTSNWVAEPDGDGHYQMVGYRYRVTNQGNVPDTANVSVEGNQTWYMRGAQRFFGIEPGQFVESYVTLRPPSNATNETDPERARLSVISESFRIIADEKDAPAPTPVTLDTPLTYVHESIQTNFTLVAQIPTAPIFLKRGTPLPLVVAVTNAGHVPDVVNVTPRLSGVSAHEVAIAPRDLDVNASAIQVLLDPGQRRELRFDLRAPDGLSFQDLARVEFDVASANWRAAARTNGSDIRASGPDITVEAVGSASAVYTGREATLSVSGRNVGDADAPSVPLVVRYLRDGAWVNVGRALNVSAAGHSTWSVQVPLNTTGLAGRYRVEARADPDGALPELEDENNNALIGEFVVRTTAFEVEAPAPQVVVPGERLRLTEGGPAFYVRNLGSHDETFELRLTSSASLFDATATRLVPANQRLAIDLELDVPDRPGVTSDVLHARVTIPAEGRARQDAEAAVTIEDRNAPRIEPRLPSRLVAGTETVLEARIVDETLVRQAFAQIGYPGNRSQVLQLVATGAGDVFQARFTPLEVGAITLSFEARDSSDPPNVATSGPHAVGVIPSATPPQIVLQSPNGTQVGAGGIVRWSVLSDAPSVQVQYARNGGPRVEIQPPYVLRTDDWPEGSNTLVVSVEDSYGRRAEETFRLTRDVAPPQLVDLVFERRADGLVDVRVVGSSDAVSGTLTATDGRAVQLEGRGPFEGVVSADAGENVRITLTDAAGNAATFEAAVPKTGNLPGPSLVVLLGALVVLALVQDKRRAR